jgi:alpha-tubulin suppressor-like RCC1 family protein
MKPYRTIWLLPIAVFGLGACMSEVGGPLGLDPLEVQPAPHAILACQADVLAGSIACASPTPSLPSGISAVLLGRQGVEVLLESEEVTYNTVTQVFRASVTVRNLTTQSLGTTDGSTVDPAGVRIFFLNTPTTTGGTGSVTVANATDTHTFTAANQPYFQYDQALSPGKGSLSKVWEWNVPSTVQTFAFRVGVSAAVPDEEALAPGLHFAAQTIAAGELHSCGLTLAGKAYCWGSGHYGQLGDGQSEGLHSVTTPVAVAGGHTFASITVGAWHSCGLTVAGQAYCWGRNDFGQLGNGSIDPDSENPASVPVPVTLDSAFISISAGHTHTCAVTDTGAAYCWGRSHYGQLGNGSEDSQPTPIQVSSGEEFASVSAGRTHSCALTTAGEAYCWGDGAFGQLGQGSPFISQSETPVEVVGGHTFTEISAGGNRTCGVTTSGAAYCWGNGGLGNEEVEGISSTPVAVQDEHTFASVSAGDDHTCGVTTAGKAYCWGAAYPGRLGNGQTNGGQSAPVAVSGSQVFTSIVAGYMHSCGVTPNGRSYCWGAGEAGKLGNGSVANAVTPVAVSTITNFALLEPAAAGTLACGGSGLSTHALGPPAYYGRVPSGLESPDLARSGML